MEWKSATTADQGLQRIPKRWLLLHYYEALNILFRFENSLRVFVYAVLKNHLRGDWKVCSFGSGDDVKTVQGIASKRIRQAENFGYLGYDIASPIMHLTSGELIELLTADAHWPKFRQHFRGGKEIIKNKLLEIGAVRNSLAHFRPISPNDIELIKQNSRHVLVGIEVYLSNLFNPSNRVPTNTDADWYRALGTLGTDHLSVVPHSSGDEEWLDVRVNFSSPQLESNQWGDDFYAYTVGNLVTPNILLRYEGLRAHVTYVTENLLHPQLNSNFDIEVVKQLGIVFQKSVLERNLDEVVESMRQAFLSIAGECDLLKQDNLARGSLVEPAQCHALVVRDGDEPRWKFMTDRLLKAYEPAHPDEYWGAKQYVTDVVGGSRRYPWMPEDVSQLETFGD